MKSTWRRYYSHENFESHKRMYVKFSDQRPPCLPSWHTKIVTVESKYPSIGWGGSTLSSDHALMATDLVCVEMIRRQSKYFIKTLMQSLCLVILVCMAPYARPFLLPSTSSSSPSSLVAPLKGAHRDLNPHSTASSSSRTPSTSHGSNLSSSSPTSTFDTFASFITAIQREIIQTIETEDGTDVKFLCDEWERDGGRSHGATCVLEGGAFIEKGAVSISIIQGKLSAERAASMSARGRDLGDCSQGDVPYAAAALSLVLHSANPHLPTFRSDVRYFECQGKGWFGGGADLTPYYLHDGDIVAFHALYRGLCDAFDEKKALFPKYKKWCDSYFFLPGRQEHRGTGGIFFDDLEALEGGGEEAGEEAGEEGVERARMFTEAVARSFMPSYLPLVRRRRDQLFDERQKQWMLLRRGRYLEFNLLYDRGVKFGLAGGRFESVMVSAPPMAAWKYNHTPEEGSEEARLLAILKTPRDWV
ncbi:coproporphyrinogen iii oxidase [Nannochloropsis gaditana]|uniref:Coproporphyrinogen iii oxidase n=1 Tax=Nannochloropsis gaditana TaxID=72520 RepID=W7TK31_9STRA|nr:coproporphyrinogen iii oxidase [Nannochloropsis gaditana]